MNRQTFLCPGDIKSPIAKIRKELDDAIDKLGITITDKNVSQVISDHPEINRLYQALQEEQFCYRRTADDARMLLTREQRRSWKACGPYKDSVGKINQIYSNRSVWLCWLRKRASVHSLPGMLGALISAEYHHLTLKEYLNA